MSRNNNVNPGQYKVAGRERQGEQVIQDRERAKATRPGAKHEPVAPAPRKATTPRQQKRKS